MAGSVYSPRIGIYGSDESTTPGSRGCSLWPLGYGAAVSEAGGTPVSLVLSRPRGAWQLEDLDGVLLVGRESDTGWQCSEADWLCRTAREHGLPLLGVDQGLH